MPLRLLLILGALSAFGPLAIDFYLPSFPALAEAFGTDVEHVQQSLAVYFIGLACGQLIYGPLADRYGRRGPLLFGVTLFVLASLACALAPSLDTLILARLAQALGGCGGMVVSRAVVRDLCEPRDAAKVFSQLMLVMGVAPILAPLAGGLLLQLFGWQSIFYCLTLFSALVGLALYRWLPETLPTTGARLALRGSLGRYLRLFRDVEFLTFALAGGLSMAAMFAYVAGSPFVFIELYGVPADRYGWLFGANAAGFILAAQLNSWLMRFRGPGFWLRRLSGLFLLCTVALLVCAVWQAPLWLLMLPLFLAMGCLGCILPNAGACAMARQGGQAGSASALMGSLQFVVAALASSLVGLLHDGTAMPMAVVIVGCAALGALMAWYSGQVEAR